MYKYSVFNLTDANLNAYKRDFEAHIKEDIQNTIGTFIGLKMQFSLDWDSEYFTGLDLAWKIARGEDEYMDDKATKHNLRQWKDSLGQMIQKNENAKVNGTILPRSYVFQPLTRKYLFDNVADYALILADIRISAMLDEFLAITQARLLGGFKQRESIVREIQSDSVKWIIGADGNYMIKGKDYISILKDRNRWYWTDNVKRTKDRNRIS
ncbi:MAG TPA: hypothetical protein ENN47_01950 [Mesotoga infera]|uniref:Uncharacterized protein n=1 Tax=Mesotoga infera TaxID=1236046 RepID=A0A7C1CUY0_9BACT|nr:hypothetical protein [Mesotoga infera]